MQLLSLKTETDVLGNNEITVTIATGNPHKLEEFNAINKNRNIHFEIVKGNFNPIENGISFEENSLIKAKEAAKISKNYSLADDSGLCVNVLDNAPGLYSARYAGTQQEKIKKLLNELKNIPIEKRTAYFISVITLVDKKGKLLYQQKGTVDGLIIDKPNGANGFGYDPIFFVPKYSQTMAEMSNDLKNSISHRANALIPTLNWLSHNILKS